jgi:ABC-type branched-subunit amino acid transport system substrate-binding protein
LATLTIVATAATATTASAASHKTHKSSPINVMTIDTSSGTAVPLQAEIGATAVVYEKYINAHGGIAGHPLHVTVCNDQGTESQAVICAEQAVSDKDVAVVGSFSEAGGNEVVPILQQANIAWIGDPAAAFPEDQTSPVSFPVIGSQDQNAALIGEAYQHGCKEVSIIENQTAAAIYTPIFQAAAKAYGETINQIVAINPTSADYSPYVAQLLSGGTDCVVTAIGTQQFASFLPPWVQSGTKATIYAPGGQLSPTIAAGYTSFVNGSYNVSAFPDISSAALTPFRVALAKYDAPTGPGYNYDSAGGVGTWAGWVVFTNIAASIKGPINNNTFLKTASHSKSVSSDGILPFVDFAKPWTNGPAGFLRSFNCGVTVQKLTNGQWVQTNSRFQNADMLLQGTGKLGPQLLPTSPLLACQS